jgi:hypothetical protein
MSDYVVVFIAGDGSISVNGTPSGRAFKSERSADRLAKRLRDRRDPEEYSDVFTSLIESDDTTDIFHEG